MSTSNPASTNRSRQKISRRDFLRLAGCAAGGGVLYFLLKPPPAYAAGVRPPGALPAWGFSSACIHCGRCEVVCDQNAIRLDTKALPYVSGLDGWCDFCMKCGEACPTGALLPVDPKTAKIATAIIDQDRCIAWNWTGCRLCYERCAELQQAIWLDEELRPHVDETLCNGCGACVFVCPQSAKAEMHKKHGKAISLT